MAYTVPVSFDKFVENISLPGEHKDTAATRKDHIVSLLSNTFTILDAFPTGSIPNGTALKTQSDLDVMVVLHWGKHVKGKSPEAVLQEVRDALGEYHTGVRKNGQAVTLHYKSWPNVDIVPVSRCTNDDGSVNYYEVPDINSGQWLRSRPRKHTKTLAAKATACGHRFKPLIRMAKEWNRVHSDLMQSFHIEVLCIYLKDEDDRDEILGRLETARDKARDAWYHTYNGRGEDEEAIQIWRQIFGDRFPAYG